MRTSNERCSTPGTRIPTRAEPGNEGKSPERRGALATPSRGWSLVPDRTGGQVVAVGEPLGQGLSPESVDVSLLAALLRRACGPSVVGAVVGRARLRDELARQLGCSAPMAQGLIDAMVGRGLIRQEVHRDGWVHWVVLR